MKDLIILGSGPAGLAAAIYAARAELDFCVVEKEPMSGGQIITTSEIDNYPGLYHMGGFDLGVKFREHAEQLGAQFVNEEVSEVKVSPDRVDIELAGGETMDAKTVIVATGAKHRKLGVPGEEELLGSGVSYCATCDGAFFKGKDVAVIGGGDVALADAMFLSRMCQNVYLIHRRSEFRGAKSLVTSLKRAGNVHFILDAVVTEIKGKFKVENITVQNVKTEGSDDLPVDGVFIAVGMEPQSGLVQGQVETDNSGYIVADESCETSKPNVFAAGDVRTKALRQVITAAADGANAITSVEKYLACLEEY